MMGLAAVLDKLYERDANVKRSGSGYSARCPAHADEKNSLSVSEGADGKLLVNCHAGCTFDAVMTAIGTANGQPNKKDTTPKFHYTDGEVTRLAESLIDEWKNGGAVVDWLRGRGISRDASLALRLGATQRTFPEVGQSAALAIPLYHGNELVGVKYRAVPTKDYIAETGSDMSGLYGRPDPDADEILLLEGPIDTALALSYRFNALGIQSAEVKPTREDVALLGKYPSIFVIGDNDSAGIRAMNTWQLALTADHPEAVVRVTLGCKDIGELYAEDPKSFQARLTTILRIARGKREFFELTDLLDEDEILLAQPPERSIVEKLVPAEAITMFFGEEKSGKSILARYFAKCVANGVAVFGKYPVRQRPVLILDLENNGADMVGFRDLFARLGKDKVRYRTRKTGIPDLDGAGLLAFCEKYKPLLILDSMTKFLAGAKPTDPFHPGEMSAFFDKLLALCAAGATIILIHHATKADAERYANSHQIGANVARSFVVVSEDRPRLNRVRFEGQLFRTGEPVTENLIAFPVLAETGHFALADFSESPVDRLVQFVKAIEAKGEICTPEIIKSRKGIRRNRSQEQLDQAVEEGKLWRKRGCVSSVPDGRYESNNDLPYPEPVQSDTE